MAQVFRAENPRERAQFATVPGAARRLRGRCTPVCPGEPEPRGFGLVDVFVVIAVLAAIRALGGRRFALDGAARARTSTSVWPRRPCRPTPVTPLPANDPGLLTLAPLHAGLTATSLPQTGEPRL